MKQPDLFNHQAWCCLQGRQVGVDEVGRGPIVGDVVAAAVILPPDCGLHLTDSKKLSENKREILAEQIKAVAIDYAIVAISPKQIDRLNILQATLLAMQQAVKQLKHPYERVMVDGNRCPDIPGECIPVVKGDAKVAEISAASILAKVFRDEQMLSLHQRYPQYGFDRHKGYPTPAHLDAIRKFGIFDAYRKSFKPVKELLQKSH